MFKYVFWFLLFFNGGFLTGGATAPPPASYGYACVFTRQHGVGFFPWSQAAIAPHKTIAREFSRIRGNLRRPSKLSLHCHIREFSLRTQSPPTPPVTCRDATSLPRVFLSSGTRYPWQTRMGPSVDTESTTTRVQHPRNKSMVPERETRLWKG